MERYREQNLTIKGRELWYSDTKPCPDQMQAFVRRKPAVLSALAELSRYERVVFLDVDIVLLGDPSPQRADALFASL